MWCSHLKEWGMEVQGCQRVDLWYSLHGLIPTWFLNCNC